MSVSRETSERLAILAALVRKWTPRINLIAPGTVDQIETRHIADSLQLRELAPETARTWIDVGSGGGFPGLVIAATEPALAVTLVESDQRKAVFLRTAAREMGLAPEIIARRIEDVPPRPFDVVSARALAPLEKLLPLARPFLAPGGIALFPKGRQADSELTAARAGWHIRAEPVASRTDPAGTILRLREFEPIR